MYWWSFVRFANVLIISWLIVSHEAQPISCPTLALSSATV